MGTTTEFQTPATQLLPLYLVRTLKRGQDYDNAMLQRVPYMVVIPGMDKGGIIDTYGGEIDMLPTLEHLLGIESNKFLQVGQDMLSPEHDQSSPSAPLTTL